MGLKVPTTIDEWYTVLKAFKEKDPNGNNQADEIPFISTKTNELNRFMHAYGLAPDNSGFINSNGKVKFSYIEPAYKQFLATMRQWYKEGLIDPDYAAVDRKMLDAKMTGNIAGATYGGAGTGFMGLYMKMMKDKDPNFKLVAAPYPKAPDGKVYGAKDKPVPGVGTAITTTNKHVKETVKWLDYAYSPEGNLLWSYGPEGEAWKMVNGKPQYTDLVLNNPKGFTFDQAHMLYGLAAWGGPFVQPGYYWETAVSAYPETREALDIWRPASDELLLPPITPTPEEGQRLSSIMNEVNTYVDEMKNKFIMGQEPLENFDKYVQTLKNMNIDEAIRIQQAALDRYNKR